jgi:hypothetical protein
MDAFDPRARTVQEYLGGTAGWRTDLYAGPTSGTLMTHAESIELFETLGVQMTPELKSPVVPMPFDGFSQEDYARKLIDEYEQAGVPPRRVWPQSSRVRHDPPSQAPSFALPALRGNDLPPALFDLCSGTRLYVGYWHVPGAALHSPHVRQAHAIGRSALPATGGVLPQRLRSAAPAHGGHRRAAR